MNGGDRNAVLYDLAKEHDGKMTEEDMDTTNLTGIKTNSCW